MLNIIVCIKQVPNTDKVKFDWKKGRIIRENIPSIMNPDDEHAIEMALQLKGRFGAKITALSLGPSQAESILREAYALGVDRCILISDKAFAGSDSLITSKILYRTIIKIASFDIILTGFETIDGNTAQVSYQLAEFLKIPHITKISNFDIRDSRIIIDRLHGHELQKISSELPVLIAVNKETNRVRAPKLLDIKNCFTKTIEIFSLNDIGGDEEEYGLLRSPTVTIEGDIIKHIRKRKVFDGTIDQKVDKLVSKLKKYGMV